MFQLPFFTFPLREFRKVWHVFSTAVLNSANSLQLGRNPWSSQSLRKEVTQTQATTDPSRFSRLSARCLYVSSMTNCLPSYRHGYMTASPDLWKVTGQFPSFWGLARNGAGSSTIQVMLAFSFLTNGRHSIGCGMTASSQNWKQRDTRLSICLNEELLNITSPNQPPLKVAHPRPQRLEQVYPRVPFLALYFFPST